MPDGRVARKILELTTTPERAEAAAGDYLELAPTRGQTWFWKSILRTTAAQAFTDEGRKSMSLLPAMLDTLIYVSCLFFLFAQDWTPGGLRLALLMITAFASTLLIRWIFPAWRIAAHRKARFICGIAMVSVLFLFFR